MEGAERFCVDFASGSSHPDKIREKLFTQLLHVYLDPALRLGANVIARYPQRQFLVFFFHFLFPLVLTLVAYCLLLFLVAYTRLYKSLCRFVGRLVRPSVGLSVRPSVGPSVGQSRSAKTHQKVI